MHKFSSASFNNNNNNNNNNNKTYIALTSIFLFSSTLTFSECAHSVAMISHAITVIGKAIKYLSPDQAVATACDQPLFAPAKTIQWSQRDISREDEVVVMLGGLHIEQVVLEAIGTWLAGSRWVEVLSQMEIITTGRAEAHSICAHITRTRYAHQVTAASLFILQKQAYKKSFESVKEGEEADSFSTWRSNKEAAFTQFKY